jgi:hypothetical protein
MRGRGILLRCRGFHSAQGGQISFLMVFSALALVGLVGMVVNTGDQAAQKIAMQNTADSVALSGGAWIARGLNLTAMVNVFTTKMISTAILINAMQIAVDQLILVAEVQLVAWTACIAVPVIGAGCAVMAKIVEIQLMVLNQMKTFLQGVVKSLSSCPDGALWSVMRMLETVSAFAHGSFGVIAQAEAVAIARANGAELAFLVPGTLPPNLTLPTRKGSFQDFCGPTRSGGKGYELQRYRPGEGPFLLGKRRTKEVVFSWFSNLFGWPIFEQAAEAQYDSLCGGGSSGPIDLTVTSKAKDLSQCAQAGGSATWTFASASTTDLVSPNEVFKAPILTTMRKTKTAVDGTVVTETKEADPRIDQGTVSHRQRRLRCPERPSEILIGGYRRVEGDGSTIGSTWQRVDRREIVDNRTDPPRKTYRYTIRLIILTDAGEVTETKRVDNPVASCRNLPSAWIMADKDLERRLNWLGVAKKPISISFMPAFFDAVPSPLVTYAQVEVYNALAPDTFTQDWRVHLVPARLLDDLSSSIPVPLLADAIDAVNNH